MKKLTLLVSLALALGLVVGCPQPNDSGNGGSGGTGNGNGGGTTPTHIPVTDIEGVIKSATVGIEATLTGTVVPESATKKAVLWSVKDTGTTGVTELTVGNKFTAQTAGTLTVLATIKDGKAVGEDYTKEFSITVNAGFEAVTNITMDTTEAVSGTEFTLRPTVVPHNATNQNIAWSVVDAGGTGVTDADLQDGKFTATMGGTLKVKATIENGMAEGTDYTKEFTINVEAQKYTLTIITGTNEYTTTQEVASGVQVQVVASALPGYNFSRWTSTHGGSFANVNDNRTVFTMPANNTTIKAHYTPSPASIRVNNVEITEENKADVLKDGTVSFNSDTQTLTLNGANLTIPGGNAGAVISINTPNTVTINLEGTNTMSNARGIYVDPVGDTGGNLHITGTGSLAFDGNNTQRALWLFDGNFSMDNGTFTITNGAGSHAISVSNDTTLSGTADLRVGASNAHTPINTNNLVLEDTAKLTATTTEAHSVSAQGSITMLGGEIITQTSGSYNAIVSWSDDFSMASGSITASNTTGTQDAFYIQPTLASGSQYAVMQAGESESNLTTNETNTTTFTNGKYVHIEVTN